MATEAELLVFTMTPTSVYVVVATPWTVNARINTNGDTNCPILCFIKSNPSFSLGTEVHGTCQQHRGADVDRDHAIYSLFGQKLMDSVDNIHHEDAQSGFTSPFYSGF